MTVITDADRTLLENAAKAIGYEVYFNKADACQLFKNGEYVRFWNPLKDDSDAFRLAVELRFEVYIHEEDTRVVEGSLSSSNVPHGDDARGATRRAIVCVAAEIGRNKS